MTSTDPATLHAPARYHSAAIVLHWLIAALLVYQFALGLRLEDKAAPAEVFTAYQQHKSVGIAILALSLARLVLRLAKPRPAEVGRRLTRLGARLTHWGFYAIMLLAPLSGWIIVSTARIKVPTLLFGLVPLANLPAGAGAHDPAELAHTVLGWALPLLLALHLAGVLYHWRKADDVPARMLPRAGSTGVALAAAIGGLGLAAWLGRAGPLPDLWSSLSAPKPAAVAEAPQPVVARTDAAPPEAETAPSEVNVAVATESAAAASCDWTVQSGSRLGFVADYSGSPVNGTFRKWSAAIHFCEDDPASGTIAATIGLASADTSDASRDENLAGPSFFDAAANPQARFVAKGFKLAGAGRYIADGTLTLRGKSRPVRLSFALKVTGDQAAAQGSARLNRLAFGVGTDEWAATDQIADAVLVNFNLRAKRK